MEQTFDTILTSLLENYENNPAQDIDALIEEKSKKWDLTEEQIALLKEANGYIDGFTENADLFGWFGIGRPLGVPTPVWIMGIVFLAAWYMLHHTRLGRYIYALGGNEAATRLSGLNVNKIKIIVYSLCGLLASLAGIIEVARLSSAQPTAGTGYELDAIAAVVLGGTSLAGGKGRIVGTLIGALILGFLNNGLNLLGVSSYYQMIVKAVVILLAVLVDNKKQ